MLNNGQVDCVVIDNAPAKEFIAANPGLKLLDTAYVEESYAIGVGKGNTELKDAINTALEELKADGCNVVEVDNPAEWAEACAEVISENTKDQADLYQQLLDLAK